MDRFVDFQHVRLRNRKLDKYYLCADDDGEGVSISQRRNSLNTPWRVHIHDGADGPQLLLHSAAYGRYLAATATPAPPLHHGFRAKQRDYDQPVVPSIMRLAVRAGLGGGVLLQSGGVRYLRANGKYLRWNTGVTVENRDIEKVSAMMRWNVETIRLRERPSRIPAPIRTRLPEDLSVIVSRHQPGAWQGIRFVQATPDGLFPEAEQDWSAFYFRGRSLYHLRDELARQVNQQPNGIAMCVRAGVRAGRYGRPTSLVVDLPRGGWGDILQIIVVISRNPALAFVEQSIGDDGSGEMKLEVNNDCRTQPSQAGSQQSVHRELLHKSALAFVEQSIGDDGSGEMKLEVNNDCRTQPSQAGSQQSIHRELLHKSGSAGQSLTEHPDVSIEVAQANLLVAANRSRSITKELTQATDRLVYLQQQNIAALPKEERKAVIKEMKKLKEKTTKLDEAAALANEELAKEQDKVTRAVLRHGL